MEVAVVGGGIGGMMTALLLTRAGAKVTLFEKSDRLGGRLRFEEHGPYRIDQGPTIVLLPEMILEGLEAAGIDRSRLSLLPCDPLYAMHFADGSRFLKYRGVTRQLDEIRREFPGEEAGFLRFFTDMYESYHTGKAVFLERAFYKKRDMLTVKQLKTLYRLQAFRSVRSLARRYFRDRRLQDAYSLQTLYIGGGPAHSPGLYSIIPFSEHAFGIWYVKGGYAHLSEVLAEELADRKVTVHLDTPVTGLVLQEGVCNGLVAKGQEQPFDAVIYNGDFPHLHDFVPEQALPRRTYQPSSGCVLVYLGVGKRWNHETVHQFFLPERFEAGMDAIFRHGNVPEDPSFYTFSPVVIDPEAAPTGESVLYFLIPVPVSNAIDWQTAAPPLVEHVLKEAERRAFPGLREAIRWKKIRTPHEAKQDGLYEGGSFGIAPTLWQSGAFRPQNKPTSYRGLYAVGASTHPGGGIPIVIQGARTLSQTLIKELRS